MKLGIVINEPSVRRVQNEPGAAAGKVVVACGCGGPKQMLGRTPGHITTVRADEGWRSSPIHVHRKRCFSTSSNKVQGHRVSVRVPRVCSYCGHFASTPQYERRATKIAEGAGGEHTVDIECLSHGSRLGAACGARSTRLQRS